MSGQLKQGDRVTWRGKPGTITSDYWRHRDRFSVRFDGDSHDLDFGAEALRRITPAPGERAGKGERDE